MTSTSTSSGAAPATEVTLREATPDDADTLGRIFFEAFESIASRHAFPTEPVSREFTAWRMKWLVHHPAVYGLVAERDGQVVGSNFVDERSAIAGIGPISVEPGVQGAGVGRALMEGVLARERERGAAGVRLVQTAYNYRSLSLYAKLGFVVREPLSVVQGAPLEVSVAGHRVRPAERGDADAADALAHQVHGHTRGGELRDAIDDGTAVVVEREERITGYATGFGYPWHAVAETNDDLHALLACAQRFRGLGILVPSRNAELLRWCLAHGLRIVQQSTLMSIGLYNEPAGAWLPSIVF
ncbi:MAG TPA: GNAT family N-acetyltransferase [Solirubrobacteraceae bacterium]